MIGVVRCCNTIDELTSVKPTSYVHLYEGS